jgi:hypothetical protein
MDPIHHLQTAARRAGQHIAPHRPIAKVRLEDFQGLEVASLSVPSGADEIPETVPEPLAVPGWDFTGAVPRFDGTLVPISGQKLRLLRVLAESEGPLPVDELRRKAWKDPRTVDVTIRWTIGKLGDVLREAFPGLETPITNGIDGYSLALR